MAVMATASFTTPITDDAWAVQYVQSPMLSAATLVQNLGYPLIVVPEKMDIVAIYSSLQVVASAAATATLYKISGVGTAGLVGTGTAITSALTFTATDYTAGQLHDIAEKAVAGTWVNLVAGTILGIQVSNDQATTGLRGLQFTFALRKSGYITNDAGNKFYPVPNANF